MKSATRIATPAAEPRAKFAAARRELAASLVERDEEVDLALTALIAREHLLLVGPPGAGKSLLLDGLLRFVRGPGFSILLTKFSMPEEVFGPLDIDALQHSRYRRNTANRLPEAVIAYLDEVWKASSAILNTLIRAMNERAFENDGCWVKLPLRMLVASSNEYPSPETGQDLSAMLDRFLFRKDVDYVAGYDAQERLFDFDNALKAPAPLSVSVTPEEVDRAHAEATALPWSEDAKDALRSVVRELAREGVRPGDRRKHKAVTAARAAAYLDGSDEVRRDHLEVLQHVLWDQPGDQARKCRDVVARVANPVGARVSTLKAEADAVLAAVVPGNLDSHATTSAKLQEIGKQVKLMAGNARADRVLEWLRGEVRRINRATYTEVGI